MFYAGINVAHHYFQKFIKGYVARIYL